MQPTVEPATTEDGTDHRLPRRGPTRGRGLHAWVATILFALAAAIGAGSFLVAYWIREGRPLCDGLRACRGAGPYLAIVPFAALVRGLVALRRRPWLARRPRGFLDEILEGVRDAALGSVALIVFTFLFRSGYRYRGFSYSRLIFALDLTVAVPALALLAAGLKVVLVALRRRGRNQLNLVLVGGSPSAAAFKEHLAEHRELGYRLVATLTQDRNDPDRLRRSLLELEAEGRIDVLMLADRRVGRKEISQIVAVAELGHLEVEALPELFGLPPAKVDLQTIGTYPVLGLLREPLTRNRRAAKRASDLVVGPALLAVASPFMAVMALGVKLSSPGPIVIRQERVGMDGRPFRMLKFRTMEHGADAAIHDEYVAALIGGETPPGGEGTLYKLTKDPRVTPVGRFLRRLSLDELPQLVNVIRGEMSLVGPRPALPSEVALYKDWHRRRLEVRPGITGLWQVGGRARLDFDDMVRLDIHYIENVSPLLDLLIMLRTIPAILRKETG